MRNLVARLRAACQRWAIRHSLCTPCDVYGLYCIGKCEYARERRYRG